MQLKDSMGLWGILGVRVYDIRNGKMQLIRTFTKKNQIVNDGRQAVLELLAPGGLGQADRQLFSISAGTNNTPPTIVNTRATMTRVWDHDFTVGEITYVASTPNDFYVWVQASMPALVHPGVVFTEAGVFTRGDGVDPLTIKLYARQTHPAVTKTATMVIAYDWRFGISIQ